MQNSLQDRKSDLLKSRLLVFTVVVLGALTYAGNVFSFNISEVVDIICLLVFPFLTISEILAVSVFLAPINSGITVLYIFGYAALVILLKKRSISSKLLLVFIAIAFHELILNLSVDDFRYRDYLTYIVIIFIFLYGLMEENIKYKSICYSYIFGATMLLLTIFTTTVQSFSLDLITSGVIRIGAAEEIQGFGSIALVNDNSNNIGYYSAVATVLILLMLKNAKRNERFLLILALVVNVLIGAFTISRTWMVLVLAGTVFAIFTSYKGKKKWIVIFGVLAVFIPLFMVLQSGTDIVDAFTDRMNLISEDTRGSIFERYMSAMFNNPIGMLVGTGALTFKTALGITGSMHNGLQQIFVAYGIPGVMFWLWILFSPIKRYFNGRKFEFYKVLPLLVAFIFTQTIQFLNPYMLMIPYMVGVCYMKIEGD